MSHDQEQENCMNRVISAVVFWLFTSLAPSVFAQDIAVGEPTALLRVYVDVNCTGKLQGADITIDGKLVGNTKPGEAGITEMVSIGNHHIQGASHSFWTFHFTRLVWNTTQVVPAAGYTHRLHCGNGAGAATPAFEVLRTSVEWTVGKNYTINVTVASGAVVKQTVTVLRAATIEEWLASYADKGLVPTPEQDAASKLPNAHFYAVDAVSKK
jgi:hypothetical protein